MPEKKTYKKLEERILELVHRYFCNAVLVEHKISMR